MVARIVKANLLTWLGQVRISLSRQRKVGVRHTQIDYGDASRARWHWFLMINQLLKQR